MHYSQSPPLAQDDTAQEESPRGFSRDQDARNEPRFGRRPPPPAAPIYASYSARPSIGRRMFRSVARFVILISIGVGATLGWQTYGDMAKQIFASYAPEQAWLLSYLPGTTKPLAVAAAPATPALQLEPLAANLEFVRRSVEQIAIKQEQMIRNIASLQAADEEFRAKASAPPPASGPANSMAAVPPPRPAAPKLQPAPGAPARPSSAPLPLTGTGAR
jgi:hypothetical protein